MSFARIANSSSCDLPWTNVGGSCTGHGTCVLDAGLSRYVCRCDAGWSGNSDFRVTSSLTSCHISYVIIRVMWAILLAVTLFAYIWSIPKVRFLFERHNNIAKTQRSAGRVYRLSHNTSLFNVLLMMTIGCPLVMLMCILKMADPEIGHVGADCGL